MVIGSVIEFIGCTIWSVHYAAGPIFSTSDIYYSDHAFLIYIPFALNVMTKLVEVSLFHRWGAFGTKDTFFKRHLEAVLVAIALVFLVYSMLLSTGVVSLCSWFGLNECNCALSGVQTS